MHRGWGTEQGSNLHLRASAMLPFTLSAHANCWLKPSFFSIVDLVTTQIRQHLWAVRLRLVFSKGASTADRERVQKLADIRAGLGSFQSDARVSTGLVFPGISAPFIGTRSRFRMRSILPSQ